MQAALAGDQSSCRAELDRVRQQIERLVDALVNGTPAAALADRLAKLEARRLSLETELAQCVALAPRLHPNLAEVHRQKIILLADALCDEASYEAREIARGLVERIVLVPEGGRLRVEGRGELGTILRLASGAGQAKAPAGQPRLWWSKLSWLRG